jgi:DNA-binding NarL/FixJ family response regulator
MNALSAPLGERSEGSVDGLANSYAHELNGELRSNIRVVLADDDLSVRNDLRRLLDMEPDIDVVAVAHDGSDAIQQCLHHAPDVVVLDVRMPILDGISAARLLRANRGDGTANPPAVLILTTFDLDEYVLGAVRAGAAGFLLKDQAPEQLADAIRTVARGDAILAPRATARLLEELTRPTATEPPALQSLTRRERDVLDRVVLGRNNTEIADELLVSLATVKTHVSNLLMKLSLENRLQVVVWAYEHGVVRSAIGQ